MSAARDAGEGGRDEAADAALIDRLYGAADADAGDAAHADADAELRPLRSVRALIARVRDEAPAVEPSQAVSARLLLAAAEHAPRRSVAAVATPAGGGLWARMRRWFAPLVSHPGLAAAATLVVVVGVGSALYVRGKGQPAEPVRDQVSRDQVSPTAPERAGKDEAPAVTGMLDGDDRAPGGKGAAVAAGSGAVTIPEAATAPTTSKESAGRRRDRAPAADPARPARAPASAPGFEQNQRDKNRDVKTGGARGAAGSGPGGGETATEETDDEGAQAQAPPPPAPAPADDRGDEKVSPDVGQPPVTVVTKEPVQQRKPAKKVQQPSAAEQARELAVRAYAAAKAGRCTEMEQLATEVRGLDAGYYDATFAKQADVVKCRAKRTPRKK